MTPTELRRIGIQLFGPKTWQAQLSKALEVDDSTVRRWVSGKVPITKLAAVAIGCLAREHARITSQQKASR